jgi:hypothetical protein
MSVTAINMIKLISSYLGIVFVVLANTNGASLTGTTEQSREKTHFSTSSGNYEFHGQYRPRTNLLK